MAIQAGHSVVPFISRAHDLFKVRRPTYKQLHRTE